MRLAIRVYDFKPQEVRVLNFLVDRTYQRRVRRALIPSLDMVVMATRTLRADVGSVLRRLEYDCQVIASGPAPEFTGRKYQDPRWYWFLPTPDQWRKIGPRVDRTFLTQLHRELDFLETRQPPLAAADGREWSPAEMGGLKDIIADSAHIDALHDERRLSERVRESIGGARPAQAADAPEVYGKSVHEGVRKIRTHTENPYTSPTCEEIPYTSEDSTSRVCVPAREHDHVPTAGTRHDHEHGRRVAGKRSLRELEDMMNEEQLRLLDEATEIGADRDRAFRYTWALRLLDGGVKQAAVEKAIGEVAMRKRQGEPFTVGPGETLNYIFLDSMKKWKRKPKKERS